MERHSDLNAKAERGEECVRKTRQRPRGRFFSSLVSCSFSFSSFSSVSSLRLSLAFSSLSAYLGLRLYEVGKTIEQVDENAFQIDCKEGRKGEGNSILVEFMIV